MAKRASMPTVAEVKGSVLTVVDVVTDDAPAVPPVPEGRLEREQAEALTERIRLTAGTIRERWERLVQLVEQARAGQVADVLGYASWTAYLSDVLGGQMRLAGPERREWVAYLTGEGMSTRAIAPIVGASPKTVARDVLELTPTAVSDDTPAPAVLGRDGRTYAPKRGPRDRCPTCGAVGAESCATIDGRPHRSRPGHTDYLALADQRRTERAAEANPDWTDVPLDGVEPERMVPTLPGLGIALQAEPEAIALDAWVDLTGVPDNVAWEARENFAASLAEERRNAGWRTPGDVPRAVADGALRNVLLRASEYCWRRLHHGQVDDAVGFAAVAGAVETARLMGSRTLVERVAS